METINLEYQGQLRCKLVHERSGSELITDAPVDNHGKGKKFSPTDLLTSSLVSCMATLMGIQANFLKIDITGMRSTATKEMSRDMPRRITKISVEFFIPGELSDRHKAALQKAAAACPVHHSLSADMEQSIAYHWNV